MCYVLREFVLYSRKGRTVSKFKSLREAGRLDLVHECIGASLLYLMESAETLLSMRY